MSSRIFILRSITALALSASPLAWATAQAQTQPVDTSSTAATPAQQANADVGGLEDIVVTAQRRAESAQSVPITLQSFSSDTLSQAAVRSTEDLSNVVGGMVIQPSAARPSIFVRGVGNNSSNTTPSVLTFVDGVYMPFGNSLDLANIASVDVLKGPQGTLFGRNATGGVIQVTTKPPSETPAARFELGYGNYETLDATAYATGGLASGVALDLALRYSNQGEGYGSNVNNGDDVFFTKKASARTRLRAELSDATTVTVSADYSRIRGTVGTNVSPAVGYDQLFVNGALRDRFSSFFPGRYDVNTTNTPFYRSREWGVSGTIESELSDVTLRSITAYRHNKEDIYIDFDGGPANAINLNIERAPRTSFTQELQALSDSSGPFQWVVGAFYYYGTQKTSRFQINTNLGISKDTDKSGSIYAQGSYEIFDNTKLTLGGRYTVEKRTIEGNVFSTATGTPVAVPGRAGSDSQTFKEPTWRIALDHNLDRNVLVYASVSRGFNAGFFNQSGFGGYNNTGPVLQNPPVLPEFLTSYEVGIKSDLLDRRLRLNLSGFWYDYSGLQQQIYESGAVITINAGSARIKGLEAEIVALPIPSLTIGFNGTYLDAKYTSYAAAPNYVPQPNGSIIVPPPGSADPSFIEAAGNKIVNTPRVSWTVYASHDLETSIGTFTTSANLNYRGQTYADPANRFKIPTRYVLNVTERWTSADETLFASLWVKNLLNKRYDYAINILAPNGLVGNAAPPRTYGVTAGFNF